MVDGDTRILGLRRDMQRRGIFVFSPISGNFLVYIYW
jgi:hypothetical protein